VVDVSGLLPEPAGYAELLEQLKARGAARQAQHPPGADWYAAAAGEYGWSRDVLAHQVATRLLERAGSAPSNFAAALPAPDSELAQQLVRDPYVFDHLALSGSASLSRSTATGSGQHRQLGLPAAAAARRPVPERQAVAATAGAVRHRRDDWADPGRLVVCR